MAGGRIVKPQKPIETLTVNAEDITWIKDILKELSVKVETIDKTTTKLNTTIVGDKAYGQIGLVNQVKEHNDYIEADKTFKSKLIGGSIVLGGLWTIILKFWDKIF
jgi:hypothetical protein